MTEYFKTKFYTLCSKSSDINEHLPTLYKYSNDCESVLELGVRGIVSSWAISYGLLNNNKKEKYHFINDLNECDINEIYSKSLETDIKIEHKWINDLELVFDRNFDMVFIDTWHVYGQLKRELEKFSKITNKYIIMHDTTVDEYAGETIRCGWNAHEQSKNTGIPVEEITKGLWPAVEEFLILYKNEWKLKERFSNNNGLTILEKIN
jgi:hypothetical protein